MKLTLGVDIGGTNARAAVVERATGRVLVSAKESWTERQPEKVVAEVARLLAKVMAGRDTGDCPVGVGLAGMLNGPVVVNAPNLGWRGVDFGTALAGAAGRRVLLFNDLSAAAWGERSAGAAKGSQHVLTVFVGTGVGSAIITGGRLVEGATGVAAEFGHTKVELEGGRRCGCGDQGCLEAYVGGARLTEWMKEEGLTGTPSDLEHLAGKGDPVARRLYDFAVGHLALGIANLVTVLNPEVLVLGGGVLSHCPGMVDRIRDVVGHRAGVAARRAVRVELARLGDDSGLVGAALLAAERAQAGAPPG
ncbi:MAG: ROK family protein [Myxococcales bacterium]|nr:ROK family protein [Myxococcales bacterium]